MPAGHDSLLGRITIDLMCGLGNPAFAVTGSPFRRFWSGFQVVHPSNKSWPIILSSNRMISLQYTRTPPNWRRVAQFPEDEAPLRRKPFAEAGRTTARLVP